MTFAFVFPGQGSQSLGMLGDFAETYPSIQQTFAEASEVLGTDLWHLTQQGPEAQLNQTAWTQPAILTASVALWRLWQEQGLTLPIKLAGHSLGEYSALVCANSLKFTDAVRLVHARGQFMQEAVPAGEGAMAAVLGLDEAMVNELCAEQSQHEVLSAANLNSPGQIVIAGTKAAVERACAAAAAKGARRAILLPVSVPSHCALMLPAAKQLASLLQTIEFLTPTIPVLNNVAAIAESNPQKIRDNLIEQLTKPVQWIKTVETLAHSNIDTFIECGPGAVLTGLGKRIAPSVNHLSLATSAQFEQVTQLIRG